MRIFVFLRVLRSFVLKIHTTGLPDSFQSGKCLDDECLSWTGGRIYLRGREDKLGKPVSRVCHVNLG